MGIVPDLEKHAAEELKHALIISKQIDYLGSMPVAEPKPVHVKDDNKEMLRADLKNETETIRNYRQRILKHGERIALEVRKRTRL